MRLARLLLVFALAACGHDQQLRATSLVVTPSPVVIDTAGSVQLQARVSWSDGEDHPARLTFTATGGTISATGLYHAGNAAGDFLAIATCSCGPVDTATIQIAEPLGPQPLSPQPLASLVISITGLPAGTPAQINVTGSGGYTRPVVSSVTLDSLPAGDYVVHATGVATETDSYSPTPDSQATSLAAGQTRSVQVAYSPAAPTGLPSHPRVWMTPARMNLLRTQAAANTIRWQRVKATADAQVVKGAAYAPGDENRLPDLCETYIGTGDAQYAARAGSILTAYAVEANNLEADSGYPFRFSMPLVTMGLDWCYAGLTVAQRHQTATWLMNRADWVWPETNPSRTTGWAVTDVGNNYYWGFMMTGPAALAAAGDDTASGTVSGTNRPAYHQQLVQTHWARAAMPWMSGRGAGGAWPEGTGYDSYGRVALIADAYTTAGIPLVAPALTDALRWRLASTLPGGAYHFPIGDQARVSNAPSFTYDRVTVLDLLSAAAPDATLASQMQYWLNLIGQAATSEFNQTAVLADELLRYDPAAPVAADLSALPLGAYAAGAGLFAYRQSWTDPDATTWVFQAGPYESHNVGAANALRIWKGSFWISADANIYSASGIRQASADFNTLTVGGTGQSGYPGNDALIVGTPQVSDALVVVRGQAANTYGHPPGIAGGRNVLSDYLRTVAYLPRQDAFVIVDRATVNDPSQSRVWRWHMKDVPQVSGNTFRLQNPAGTYRCFGSVLSPVDAVVGLETRALGSTPGTVTSNVVTVTLPTGRVSDVVVTVLQCTNAMLVPLTPTATTTTTETDVMVGTTKVVVPRDETQPVRIE